MKDIPYKLYLAESELPRQWYNLRADMKAQPDPMLNPATGRPITYDELRPIFCDDCAAQELDGTTAYVDIPEEIQRFYRMYRPSPVVRAYCLEKALDTPAKIYYKFEGGNTSGSHKLNSAAAQAYYAKKQGLAGLTTETGAGQWGTALAMACGYFGIDLAVYMVKVSAQQKPYRKAVMETYGASVVSSPSDTTRAGRAIRAKNPGTGGSLGCAISEAVEAAASTQDRRYALGSVLNHVMLHQSIIGLEAKAALDQYEVYPDMVIGCAGGGSNLGGLIAPYMRDRLLGRAKPYFIAAEPRSCPSLSRGRYAYDYGDTGCITPLMRMYTLGAGYIPPPSHSGGLRYHGMSPILSKLYHDGYIDEARSVEQTKVFEAATFFAKHEGTLPAPESAHAIRVAMDEAIRCRECGLEKTILFGLTGTGYFDLAAYMSYRSGTMADHIPSDADLADGFSGLPSVPGE